MKKVKKILLGLLVLLVSWFLIHTIFIVIDGLNDNIHASDVAVVFGNEVNLDGKPSDRLKARLDKAIEIFNNQQTKTIIVSGGTGKEGFDEAKVMATYLNEHNIPLENIIIDSNGNNSEETVQNTVKIMKEKNFHSVLIISQYFHISRAKLAFQKAGVTEIYSAHAQYFEIRDVYSIIREFFAYYAYALRY